MTTKEKNSKLKKLKQAIKIKDELSILILAKQLTNAGYNLELLLTK